jgi:hypothetical protein
VLGLLLPKNYPGEKPLENSYSGKSPHTYQIEQTKLSMRNKNNEEKK